jgi:transcriptional regulator with XRE-family HTH domain
MNTILTELGKRLRKARKTRFPHDTQADFATRIRVSRGTVQSMEQGNPRVAIGTYLEAAAMLGLSDPFNTLFAIPEPEKGLLEQLGL